MPPDRVPVVAIMTPYAHPGEEYYDEVQYRDGGLAELAPLTWLVEHGYAVAIHHVRGTGGSGGCLAQSGPEQIDDGARIIEYLGRDAPFSDGNVGAYGISYAAETQLSVAGLGDPERTRWLKAIVPSQVIASQYEYVHGDGVPLTLHGPLNVSTYLSYSLQGGGRRLPLGVGASPVAGWVDHAPNTDPQRLVQRAGCQPVLAAAYSSPSGDVTDFWLDREYRLGAERVRAATLYVGGHRDHTTTQAPVGLLDRFPPDTPLKVVVGQWEHAYPDDHLVERDWRRRDWMPMVTAWFDRYLKGIDTGVEEWPDVQVQDPEGRWRAEDSWPDPSGPAGVLALGPDGRLGAARPAGSSTYDEMSVVAPCGLECSLEAGRFATFATPPLEGPLHLAGAAELELWVVLQQPDAHIGVFVDVIGRDGSPIPERSTFGMRSARHLQPIVNGRFSQRSGDPAPVGVPVRVPVRIEPNDLVVPAGGRLRIRVAGSVMDGLPSFAPQTVRILHDCGHLSALRFRMPSTSAPLLNVRESDEPEGPLASVPATLPVADGGGLALAQPCG